MIKKNFIFILPPFAFGLLLYAGMQSTQINIPELKVDLLKETPYERAHTQFNNPKKNSAPKIKIARFKKQLLKNNLSQKFNTALDSAPEVTTPTEKNPSQTEPKSKKLAKADKNKTDKEKMAKKNKEDEGKAKENALQAKNTLDEKASDSFSNEDLFENRVTSASTTDPIVNSLAPVQVDENPTENEDELLAKDDNTFTGRNHPRRNDDVESLSLFSPSYFTSLLEKNKFLEFEQALKEELSQKQKINAYSAAIHFLFTKIDLDFITYDSFIRTQFLKHSFAESIAGAFSDKTFSKEKMEYSADLLNRLVQNWSLEDGSVDEFNKIYRLSVLNAIPSNLADNEAFLNLQNSIEVASFDISDSSVEISSN